MRLESPISGNMKKINLGARKFHFLKHKKFINLGARKFHFLKCKKILAVGFLYFFKLELKGAPGSPLTH